MNSPQRDDCKNSPPAPVVSGDMQDSATDKRAAARRRFLKMGAGGSTAVLVTIMHKRAFAGGASIKKGTIVSACVSAQGIPDIKGLNGKKAILLSPIGKKPTNLICRPRGEIVTKCNAPAEEANKSNFLTESGKRPPFFKDGQFKDGCGYYKTTIEASYNWRLYEKGYCPIVIDPQTGKVTYDLNAKYYQWVKLNGDIRNPGDPKPLEGDKLTPFDCKPPPS